MKSLTIKAICVIGNDKIITCTKEDDYENYPGTLRFLGDLYVKTGWNSDKDEVYYRV